MSTKYDNDYTGLDRCLKSLQTKYSKQSCATGKQTYHDYYEYLLEITDASKFLPKWLVEKNPMKKHVNALHFKSMHHRFRYATVSNYETLSA